jgi:hypothetical protein
MKASGVAARLVLLALLVLGVGVLHTLSHAGAHGGVSAPIAVTDSHEAYPVGADEAGAVHLLDVAHVSVEEQERGHRAHAEATDVSDCFALIPSESWLAPPPCTAVSSGPRISVRPPPVRSRTLAGVPHGRSCRYCGSRPTVT